MRVAITNSVASNGGDASIILALSRAISEQIPQAEIECHDASPEVVGRHYPGLRWRAGLATTVAERWGHVPRLLRGLSRFSLARPALRITELSLRLEWRLRGRAGWRPAAYRGIDAIVSTGGTYLVESYDFDGRLFEYMTALQLGIPVVFFTQSLGPFRKRRNRRLLRKIFNRSPLVFVRDEQSRGHLRQIGVVGDHVRVAADGVFLEGENKIEYEPIPRDRPLRIGVSVRPYPPGAKLDEVVVERFAGEIAQGLERLVEERDLRVLMISTCQGISEYWIDDSKLATRIRDKVPEPTRQAISVAADFHTPDEFRSIVSGLDLMISTRMHGAIQALVMNTPVIPISYEFKTDELFDRLGMRDFVLDIHTVTSSQLVNVFERFVDEFDGRRGQLGESVRRERASASEAAIELGRVLTRIS